MFTDRSWFLADLQPLAKGFSFFKWNAPDVFSVFWFFFLFFFMTLERAKPENREKSSKEACVNAYRRLQNQFFNTFGDSWTRESRNGKGACVYATYRDRSVCAVACIRRCITGSSCYRFLLALRCCLNYSLFSPDNFISCVYRVLNIDEGTKISDRRDMHHASYQSALSSTHHLGILSSTRRYSDFTRRRS